MHPIRSVRKFVTSVKQIILQTQCVVLALARAVDENSKAVAANTVALNQLLLSAKETADATLYLARAEQHARQESGRRHDFGVNRVC